MTPEQIQLVRSSFELVRPNADAVAAQFYGRLFELDPETRPLFKNDIGLQGRKLMDTFVVVLDCLDRIETLTPVLQDLGRRHAGYGVRSSQYRSVGAALMATLEHGLGHAFDAPMREAWSAAYGRIAAIMLDATRT